MSGWLITVAAVLLLCTTGFVPVSSEKILAVAFVSTKSHKITYTPLLHELARRGHQVTILSPIPADKQIPNVREILTKDFETEKAAQFPNLFELKESGGTFSPTMLMELFGSYCEETYDLPHVHALLKEKFDLVMVQPLFNECAMGFIHKFNTTLMMVIPASAPFFYTKYVGLPALPSFAPNAFLGLTDRMTFLERMKNFAANVMIAGVVDWVWIPKMESIYRDKLGDQNLPGVDEVFSNVSLILANTHFSLSKPRPNMPDIVDVGGMHCRPAKPLPKDLDDFLNSSGEDGFIYFSMGSAIKGNTMPDKFRQIFVNTFAKLKQKVLWKWESDTMPDLPKNVKLGKWLPQQDILGHPKIRMFITHGGFGGTTEAVYHGVPLLGIPMGADQNMNMQQSEKAGFAILLEFNDVSEKTLMSGIQRILGEKGFHERAKELSKVFQDQPDKPLDRAAFWTEYIIRHKGAVHMRSAGRDLNFIQYHSLDVIVSFAAIIFGILYIALAIVRFIFRKLCGSSKRKENPRSTSGKVKKTN